MMDDYKKQTYILLNFESRLKRSKEKVRAVGIVNIIFKHMGSTDSIPQNNSLRLNTEIWSPVPVSEIQQHPTQYGHYVQLKNDMTGEVLNQYEIVLNDDQDYNSYMQMIRLRNLSQYLVQVTYLNEHKTKQVCSVAFNLKVYTEHFPLRLSDVKDIPFPENLYILKRAISGFRILHSIIGHFHITEDLICINKQGIVKVWIHADLSKNYAQNINSDVQYNRFRKKVQTISQNSMIWQLLTILDQLTSELTLPNGISFISYLKRINRSQLEFGQIQKIIDMYAQLNSAEIPQVFQSVIKIIREKQGIFDSQVDIRSFSKGKDDEISVALLENRFKQSKVQRVQSFKNQSVRSYIASQSNHTFADKLKKFDKANYQKTNTFGKISENKETPMKPFNLITIQRKQPLTQRPLVNKMSYSSISSPQAQSLTAIGPPRSFGNGINSNSNSAIVSTLSKNPLALSQSPKKSNAPTYFSQYIEPVQPNLKMVKKPTMISFGEREKQIQRVQTPQSGLLKNAPVSLSLQNSKNSKHCKSENKTISRPMITFTYMGQPASKPIPILSAQPIVEQSPYIPGTIQNLPSYEPSESDDHMGHIPISPPSIQKSSILSQAKKFSDSSMQESKHKESLKKQFDPSGSHFQNEKPIQKYYKIQPPKLIIPVQNRNRNQIVKNQQNFNVDKKYQKSVQKKNTNFNNNNKQSKPKIVKKQNPETRNLSRPFINSQINKRPANLSQQKQIIELKHQFDIDPQIASDLLKYEKLQKEQQQKTKHIAFHL